MISKVLLLNKSPKKHPLIFLIFVSFILGLLTLTIVMRTFDTLEVSGIVVCEESCVISLTLPYNKVDVMARDDLKIEYDESMYEVQDILFDEPYLNGEVPCQDIKIKTDLESEERIINFKLLYKKERIIKKIKNVVLER